MKPGNRHGKFRVARSSRALAKASRLCGLSRAHDSERALIFTRTSRQESSFRRDAKTNARDERATRKSLPHFNYSSI